ncbi:MAG: thiolase family protein [Deltaproteobacteria bacterium]|nr:thiolase family protein [Deltaproteobacteria bacterium]
MGTTLKDRYAIVGVGQSPIGEVPEMDSISLLAVAMKEAIEDAGLTNREVDGLISRGPDEVYTHHQLMGQVLGINARFSTSLTSGGASQCFGVALAAMAIEAGLCEVVVCGYGRNTWTRTRRQGTRAGSARGLRLPGEAVEFGPEYGYFGAAAAHALGCRRHMYLYGTTRDQLGQIAVTFRKHASLNPLAQMRQPITLEDYHNAPLVVDPFSLLDCSLNTDGAGAVVVTSAERARDLKQRPVFIMGVGMQNNTRGWTFDEHMTALGGRESAAAAFRMAGIGPADVDVAQLYDCFTYIVLVTLEDYGFCKKGEGGEFVASGALSLDGPLPANTSGGQLSEGHVEGMLQIVEAVRQLRGDRPPGRQVEDAAIALVSGHGGNTVCHSTLILRR